MKKQHFIFAAVVIALLFATVSFSQSTSELINIKSYETAEYNYLEGLKSDNLGLKISCAYFLGEMKSRKAVIPLMNILNTEQHEGARIIAAWSLIKIGDPVGIHLVNRMSELSDCNSVKCMCEHLYFHYLQNQNGNKSFDKLLSKSDH